MIFVNIICIYKGVDLNFYSSLGVKSSALQTLIIAFKDE